MSSSEFAKQVLIEQRRRLVSAILSHAEATFYPRLTPAERKAFREKVLASAGAYHDVCLDMIKASLPLDGGETNEEALRLLQEIHQATT